MTNNKTTALIERIISHNINVKDINTNERISCKFDARICAEKIQEALAAFEQPDQYKQQVIGQATITITRQEYESLKREQPAVREMTERELVYAISDVHSGNGTEALEIARALAKLGTIRVMEDK